MEDIVQAVRQALETAPPNSKVTVNLSVEKTASGNPSALQMTTSFVPSAKETTASEESDSASPSASAVVPPASISIPPGFIYTEPATKIVFNAPFDKPKTHKIKITNSSARRIGWAIKSTNMKRLAVFPVCGVLDPKKSVLMAVTRNAVYGQEDTNNDRITVEWTNTPVDAEKKFKRQWFQGDAIVRRKNLLIEYNP